MCKHHVCVSEFKKKSIIFCMSTYISATLTYTCARFLCNFCIHCLSVYRKICVSVAHVATFLLFMKIVESIFITIIHTMIRLTKHKFFCEMYLTYIEICMHESMLRIQLKTISITSVTQYHTKKLFTMNLWKRLQCCVCCRKVITDVVLPCHTMFE